jgi:glycosyltransferase involved in cell wall biosynthesis
MTSREKGRMDERRVSRVSVIIAVHNRPDFLEKVFLSLINQSFSDFEVVIADDGSGPEVAKCIQRYSPSFAIPIGHAWHPHNGFQKTVIVNDAVRRASSDYLVFIDGDCILHTRFLESHFRHRTHHVALGGRRVMLDTRISERLTNDDVASGRIERPWVWWHHCDRRDRKHGFFVPFLFAVSNMRKKGYSMYGSNFSLFKEDFCSVNGYDESIVGRGIEDDNLRERLKLKGISIKSVTREAIQYHLYHESSPVPHSRETINRWCFPTQAWAAQGLDKSRL